MDEKKQKCVKDLKEGDFIEVKGVCTNNSTNNEWLMNSWYKAQILELCAADELGQIYYKVHFDGFDSNFDNYVSQSYIRVLIPHIPIRDDEVLNSGELVEIIANIDDGRGQEPESYWEAAIVKDMGSTVRLRYKNDYWNDDDEFSEWTQVNKSELRRGEPSWSTEERSKNFELLKHKFYPLLEDLMKSRGAPISKNPTLAGAKLDLFDLYEKVTFCGGISTVSTKHGALTKVWEELPNYKSSLTNGAAMVKKLYLQFLYPFEQKFFRHPKYTRGETIVIESSKTSHSQVKKKRKRSEEENAKVKRANTNDRTISNGATTTNNSLVSVIATATPTPTPTPTVTSTLTSTPTSSSSTFISSSSETTSSSSVGDPTTQPKRKRGRPRKNPPPSSAAVPGSSPMNSPTPSPTISTLSSIKKKVKDSKKEKNSQSTTTDSPIVGSEQSQPQSQSHKHKKKKSHQPGLILSERRQLQLAIQLSAQHLNRKRGRKPSTKSTKNEEDPMSGESEPSNNESEYEESTSEESIKDDSEEESGKKVSSSNTSLQKILHKKMRLRTESITKTSVTSPSPSLSLSSPITSPSSPSPSLSPSPSAVSTPISTNVQPSLDGSNITKESKPNAINEAPIVILSPTQSGSETTTPKAEESNSTLTTADSKPTIIVTPSPATSTASVDSANALAPSVPISPLSSLPSGKAFKKTRMFGKDVESAWMNSTSIL